MNQSAHPSYGLNIRAFIWKKITVFLKKSFNAMMIDRLIFTAYLLFTGYLKTDAMGK